MHALSLSPQGHRVQSLGSPFCGFLILHVSLIHFCCTNKPPTVVGSIETKMATITKTTTEPRTIRLTNGTSFTPNSNSSSKTEKLALIDVAKMYSDKLEERQAVAEDIREASRTIGFFYIVNHVRHHP